MAIASGLGGSFGIGVEPSYGAAGAITRWYDVASVNLGRNKRTVQGGGLSSGTLFNRTSRRRQPIQDATGSLEMEVPRVGFGLLLAQMMGHTVTPVVVGATSYYTQTYNLTDDYGKSLVAQLGVPNASGTVVPYTFPGLKIPSFEFSASPEGMLMMSADLDARNSTDVTAYTAPTFPSTIGVFDWAFGSVNKDTVALAGVKGFSISVARSLGTERFYMNGGGLKGEPLANGKVEVTGSLDIDFLSKADVADLFAADTPCRLDISMGGETSGGSSPLITFTLPNVYFDGAPPVLDDEDVVSLSANFTSLFDGTSAPLSVVYRSTDSTP